jgi:3-oxoacyl-[acyl-carrier-protein] synthase II
VSIGRILESNRIVITGIGALSPFGAGKDAFIEGSRAGKYCAEPIARFDTTPFCSKQACLIPAIELGDKDVRLARLPLSFKYGIASADEAMHDSKLNLSIEEKDRVGVFYSTACNTEQTERYHLALIEKGPSFVSPLLFQNTTYMAGPGAISISRGITGPAIAIPGGYASGIQSIDVAVNYLLQGYIDVAIVVGADELTRLHYEALYRLNLLSPHRKGAREISRPFDAGRDGMILGEGAGAVVLESLSHARSREARIYAELAGVAVAHDAYRPADTAPSGRGLANAMRQALDYASANPESVDYIAAAANSTRLFDNAEAEAIKSVFARHAYEIPVSSIKSMIGETFAASGIFNLIACIVAISEGFLSPTINYEQADSECDLDCVPNIARQKAVRVTMANAYSFGGASGSAVLKAFEHEKEIE